MDILAFNLSWMLFNSILALVPVALTLFLQKKLNKYFRLFALFLWLLFLPNTIYLVTDLQYLPGQLGYLSFSEQTASILMYIVITILGVLTYMVSLRPFADLLSKSKMFKNTKLAHYIILNFVIAFAVVLGKFQRTHSWYVFTQPLRVLEDVYATFADSNLLFYIFIFGVFLNFIFLIFRKYFNL